MSSVEIAALYADYVLDASVCTEAIDVDFNQDCKVDVKDFVMFAASWLECNLYPSCIAILPY